MVHATQELENVRDTGKAPEWLSRLAPTTLFGKHIIYNTYRPRLTGKSLSKSIRFA